MSDNVPDEPDVFHTVVIPKSKRDERPWNLDKTFLRSQCFASLKAEFFILKIFIMREINAITEKINTSTFLINEHILH